MVHGSSGRNKRTLSGLKRPSGGVWARLRAFVPSYLLADDRPLRHKNPFQKTPQDTNPRVKTLRESMPGDEAELVSLQLATWSGRQRRLSSRLPVASHGLHSALVQSQVALGAVCLWLFTLLLAEQATASQVEFPVIDPINTIYVEADTVAEEQRGAYDVLAFQGNCQLKQGPLQATADEVTLWIERKELRGVDQPGKIICHFEGRVSASWGDGQALRDHRWMGRLFSLYPVHKSGKPVLRHDIPDLDWNREPTGAVVQAQFTQPVNRYRNELTAPQLRGEFGAPPLLGPSSPPAGTAVTSLPVPPGGSPNIPATPGAVTWQPEITTSENGVGSTRSSLPSGGIVVPRGGQAPYPAAGVPEQVMAQPLEAGPTAAPPGPQLVRQVPVADPFAVKTIQFLKRSESVDLKMNWEWDPERGENIGRITGGFKLIVNGLQVRQDDGSMMEFGAVSLEADNAVAWVRSDSPIDLTNLSSTPERPIELYLDGNIVFYQGNRVIYADRMYYNVSSEYGMVLSAEVLTPVPQYQGLLRLKADVIQQRDRSNLLAYGAAVTSSRLGIPRYWLQSDEVQLTDGRAENELAPPGNPLRPTNMRATSRSNFVYLGGIPIFYWPTFNSNLADPDLYISGVKFGNDSIFGTQVYLDWNAYQLFGLDGIDGTSWKLSTDYLSERGPAIGTRFEYERPTWLFGAPGVGFSDAWILRDDGLDTLGSDRIGLTPEETTRGRILSRHRLFLTPNWEGMLETGWISDRNFLEQFFENEWDQEKDLDTALRLRRYNGNRQLDIFGKLRVNDFFADTEWLPRVDHHMMGQDLFSQLFTWNTHTSVGYGRARTATTPTDPVDAAKFSTLPWEANSEGIRALTRQELSMPLNLGAWKVIPFASGEVGYWDEDINQQDVTRFTGQGGIKTSLPFWRAYPNVENRLFDLRGMAHKANLTTEFFYADSSEDLDRFPLYDPLDDNAQEHFRRRFVFNTFGGALPPQFDERSYALRTGMQRWVTATSKEVVDDLTQFRVGIDNRWQTKRGLPGRERIVDLVSFDLDFIAFPNADRDNFGESTGAFNYDFRYHIGDRLTLLSDGYYDLFSQGLKTISAGAQVSRPGRGDAYIGLMSIEGPISSTVLNAFANYRMNEKWIFSGAGAVDFGDTGNIGQSLGLTRIGETALVRVGIDIDHGRDNVSFSFNIEPRFLPTVRLGQLGGELVPPAGLYGVE